MEIKILVKEHQKSDLENFTKECEKQGFKITREGGGKLPNFSGYYTELKGERWQKADTGESNCTIDSVRQSSLTPIEKDIPIAYETGEWDGKRSDFVLVKTDRDEYHVARVYSGFMDGSEFNDWYTYDDYEIQGEVVGWTKLPE